MVRGVRQLLVQLKERRQPGPPAATDRTAFGEELPACVGERVEPLCVAVPPHPRLRRLADTTGRDVHHAGERDVVARVRGHAQEGQHVLDLTPRKEGRAPDHIVPDPGAAEALLQHAALRVCAEEHRDVLVAQIADDALSLDGARDEVGLFGVIRSDEPDERGPVGPVCAEALLDAALDGRDDRVGGVEDEGPAPIVLFEGDGLAREVLAEARDVLHRRSTPRVDRLVVVADHGDVPGAWAQVLQQPILRDVRVLELIDHERLEPTSELFGEVRVFVAGADKSGDQRPEVERVVREERPLVGLEERGVRFLLGGARGLVELGGRKREVVCALDAASSLA